MAHHRDAAAIQRIKAEVLTVLQKYGIVNREMTGQVIVNVNQGGITEIKIHPVDIIK